MIDDAKIIKTTIIRERIKLPTGTIIICCENNIPNKSSN